MGTCHQMLSQKHSPFLTFLSSHIRKVSLKWIFGVPIPFSFRFVSMPSFAFLTFCLNVKYCNWAHKTNETLQYKLFMCFERK